ncbi:MAG: succinate dehydrogenase cytochrome b subunit [Bacteroidota bacterium]
MSNSAILKSSLVKKYWMALTGLFLCTFLVGHLAGNLQLLYTDTIYAKDAFNAYAYFMTHNIFIKLLSYVTYISILFHAVDGFMLTFQNRKARPQKYAFSDPSANSGWASRNMAMLGTLVLAFIIMHMAQFWGKMHFGELAVYQLDGKEVKDLYTVVGKFYQDADMGLIWCFVYLIGLLALSSHLSHGFQSAFQSLGLRHPKYTPVIKKTGWGFAIVICLLFALIPFYMHFVLDKI